MGDSKADTGTGDVLDWTVLKSIQEANDASMGAMEEYLLLATGPENIGDAEQTLEFLEQSIARHELIIDQLELAADQLKRESFVRAD